MNGPVRLAFLVDSLLSRYQVRLFKSALRFARSRGACLIGFQARLLRGGSPHPSFDGSFLFDLAAPPAVDAIVVVSNVLSTSVGTEAVRSLCARSRLPVVSIGELEGIAHIDVESGTGLRTVVEHLVTDHGRRRMAFIRGSAHNPDSVERERVFRETLARLGVAISEDRFLPGTFLQPSGATAVRTLFDERGVAARDVDALVACNDQMAAGAIQELTLRRLRVPEDIAVVGFDDDDFARNCSPPLTTVAQPVERLGARAVELVLELLEGRPVKMRTALGSGPMFRASCGCRPRHSRPVPPPLSAASLEPALAECESVAARRLIKLVGTREGAPDVDVLTQALLGADEVERRAALAALERAVLRSAELGVDPLRWEHVVAPYIEAVDRFAEAYPASGERYRRRLLRVQLLINETAARTQALSRMQALQHANAIRVLGSALVSAGSLDTLRRVLEAGLTGLGIRYCCVCLFADPTDRTTAMVLMHHVSTRPGNMDSMESETAIWRSLPEALAAAPMVALDARLLGPGRAFVPDGANRGAEQGDRLVYPLVFAESPLGYAMFDVPDPIEHAWMLESIAGHLSSAIYSVLSAQELRCAREAAEKATAALGELAARVVREVRGPLGDLRKDFDACLPKDASASRHDEFERTRRRSDALLRAVDAIVDSMKA